MESTHFHVISNKSFFQLICSPLNIRAVYTTSISKWCFSRLDVVAEKTALINLQLKQYFLFQILFCLKKKTEEHEITKKLMSLRARTLYNSLYNFKMKIKKKVSNEPNQSIDNLKHKIRDTYLIFCNYFNKLFW